MRARRGLLMAGALSILILYQLAPVLAQRPYSPKLLPGQPTVKLTIRTAPRVKARVWWGRKLLGETPLDLRWPRDSGPLDVVVESKGYLTVRSRLYTFNDDRLSVQLTAEADKSALYGYRRPILDSPDGGAAPDGGGGSGGAAPQPQ